MPRGAFLNWRSCGSIVLRYDTRIDEREVSSGQRTLGLLIDNINPILFMLAITLMGIEIAPQTTHGSDWFAFLQR